MKDEPQCTGPFTNAWDCPVHRPDRLMPQWYTRTGTWPPQEEVTVKPTIGRIVHFTVRDETDEAEDRAALITAVRADERVDLCVIGSNGIAFEHDVRHVELSPAEPPAGTWHWPAREV